MGHFTHLLVAGLALASPAAAAVQAPPQSVGEVAFANSGAPAAQAAFHRGVALLHNFEYPRAAIAFQEAQKADPGFVMAYWGEAMTHNHPVWMEVDVDKAKAALAKLAPTPAERLAKVRTPRERGYLEAVELLYGDGDKRARDRAYSDRMHALFKAHPKDVDAASFYALSLLGLAHDGRDYGLYMRAAAVLEEFFPRHQRHPGVLHYLIHSYDDPTHAPLGLRAARLYGAVAPDAPHALHMTSHIFIAMGDWQSTIDANEASRAAANRLRAAAGKGPIQCGHGLEWLNYAYYQAGQPERSDAIRTGCRAAAEKELAEGQTGFRWDQSRSYADNWVRSVVEQGKRPADAPLKLDPARYAYEAFTFAYGEVLASRGDRASLASAHGRLRAAAAASPKEGAHALARKRLEIVLQQAQGLEHIASGRREAGLAALKAAAEMEKAMSPDFGPPHIEKPSFELLAEELLAAGRAAEAADAYREALKMAPGRKLSLGGLALAEKGRPGSVTTAAAAPHKH
jgi:hypothetical protein